MFGVNAVKTRKTLHFHLLQRMARKMSKPEARIGRMIHCYRRFKNLKSNPANLTDSVVGSLTEELDRSFEDMGKALVNALLERIKRNASE